MATFAELTQEVIGRGYNYEPTAVIESAIQRHYQRLEARYVWPWREATKEGIPPLEIKDLRDILSVQDKTQERPIYGQTRQWLIERFPNIEEEGNPVWWWLDNLTLRTFPTTKVDTFSARYAKKPEVLTEKAEPAMPSEWHYLIVDSAIVDLLKSNDEYSIARELKESVETDLLGMVAAEMRRDLQSPRTIVRTGWPTGYL